MASLFALADKALAGALVDRLKAMREQGLSFAQMAGDLKNSGVDVSWETVRRWCQEQGIPTHRVPAIAAEEVAS